MEKRFNWEFVGEDRTPPLRLVLGLVDYRQRPIPKAPLFISQLIDGTWIIRPFDWALMTIRSATARFVYNPLHEQYQSEEAAKNAAEALVRMAYPDAEETVPALAVRGGEDPYANTQAPIRAPGAEKPMFPGYDPEFGKKRKARFEELFRSWSASYAEHSRQCGMSTWTLLHADSLKKTGGDVVVLVRKQEAVDNGVRQAKSMGLCLDRSNFRTIHDTDVRFGRWFYIEGTDRTTVVLVDNDALSSYIWDLESNLANTQNKIEDIKEILDKE